MADPHNQVNSVFRRGRLYHLNAIVKTAIPPAQSAGTRLSFSFVVTRFAYAVRVEYSPSLFAKA